MLETIPLEGPVDLGALDDFLASDSRPPDYMQLSELDGFLAGIVRSRDDPAQRLAAHRMGAGQRTGLCRPPAGADGPWQHHAALNEIIRLVDSGSGAYRPVLVEQDDGTLDPTDWAVGFIQAMALCQKAWEPLLRDRMAGTMIAPIMLIASMTDKFNLLPDEGERLPDAEMAKLVAEG